MNMVIDSLATQNAKALSLISNERE